jgi:hypothetical protein
VKSTVTSVVSGNHRFDVGRLKRTLRDLGFDSVEEYPYRS